MTSSIKNNPRWKLECAMFKLPTELTVWAEIRPICEEFFNPVYYIKDPVKHYPETCVMHSFDCIADNLENYNAYMDFRIIGEPGMDMHFVQWLISTKYLVFSPKKTADFVTYWSSGVIKHIGKLNENDRVESKWGFAGPTLDHHIFDIPIGYGPVAKWLKWNESTNIIDLIQEFLKKNYSFDASHT